MLKTRRTLFGTDLCKWHPVLLHLLRILHLMHPNILSSVCSVSLCGTAAGGKPSWTARLLADEALLCAKVREEAGELARSLEAAEGAKRVASEAADLLYHAMVLLRAADVPAEHVRGDALHCRCLSVLAARSLAVRAGVVMCHLCLRWGHDVCLSTHSAALAATSTCLYCIAWPRGTCIQMQQTLIVLVLAVLRARFGTSGVAEKASRGPPSAQ